MTVMMMQYVLILLGAFIAYVSLVMKEMELTVQVRSLCQKLMFKSRVTVTPFLCRY